MNSQRMMILYGVGSLGGALTVLAYWALAQSANGLPFVSFKPELASFYEPMVWGGLWGFLYLLPFNVSPLIKGVIFSIFPALTHLAMSSGGLEKLMDYASLNMVVNHKTLVVLLIYALFWGVVTSYMSPRQGA
ncbi:MAG: hypothetical protein GC134_03860 [Proteobacteria bacterium]|nr:hypothetical protein [Pseudomonadota bacterium]